MIQRPPWVIVIRLPDDIAPAEAKMSFPPGSTATVHCNQDAQAILAVRDNVLADVQVF